MEPSITVREDGYGWMGLRCSNSRSLFVKAQDLENARGPSEEEKQEIHLSAGGTGLNIIQNDI